MVHCIVDHHRRGVQICQRVEQDWLRDRQFVMMRPYVKRVNQLHSMDHSVQLEVLEILSFRKLCFSTFLVLERPFLRLFVDFLCCYLYS